MVIALSTVFPLICHFSAHQRSLKAKAISFEYQCPPFLAALVACFTVMRPSVHKAFQINMLWHHSKEGPFINTVMQ